MYEFYETRDRALRTDAPLVGVGWRAWPLQEMRHALPWHCRHGLGHYAARNGAAACRVALDCMQPRDVLYRPRRVALCTTRADLDAVTAMAVLVLRAAEGPYAGSLMHRGARMRVGAVAAAVEAFYGRDWVAIPMPGSRSGPWHDASTDHSTLEYLSLGVALPVAEHVHLAPLSALAEDAELPLQDRVFAVTDWVRLGDIYPRARDRCIDLTGYAAELSRDRDAFLSRLDRPAEPCTEFMTIDDYGRGHRSGRAVLELRRGLAYLEDDAMPPLSIGYALAPVVVARAAGTGAVAVQQWGFGPHRRDPEELARRLSALEPGDAAWRYDPDLDAVLSPAEGSRAPIDDVLGVVAQIFGTEK